MLGLPGASFLMGSEDFYPEEAPVHRVTVAAFEIDVHPVTNAQFARFVADSGYVTVAERTLDSTEFPQLSEVDRAPGSLVFTPTDGPVDLGNWRAWWQWVPGADWRRPFGPASDLAGKENHPVVQVAHEDAAAYAAWSGKRLPTEAEFEYAARGGLAGAIYSWGNAEPDPNNLQANIWQGTFPYRNTGANGFAGTSVVGSFAANGFGLYDMCGNVWEWTNSPFTPDHRKKLEQAKAGCGCGCGPSSKPGSESAVQLVLKGGSHLCAPEYCHRYRPAARSAQTPDSATTHIGFRCVR
ncbi:formylglycine-generating enzyme family protein [Paeniglutamicibacter sp. NPDC091659]|uniref:formylglycine-generating enzyme family protein n=1 Tax=Paeniglutamicibacter sp. NPDC091659 TaxID=3364389 RepID=UPI003828B68B